MPTKTIGVNETVYDRLKARKREDESFTDLIDRLLDEAKPGWRAGFGSLPEQDADALRQIAEESRRSLAEGLATRQTRAIAAMTNGDDSDETP